MKWLYYNPIEIPSGVRISSKSLSINMEYDPCDGNDHPAFYIDDLFLMAKCNCFDDIQVLLTSHNDSYYKNGKNSNNRYPVTGWISLKEYKNGGGWRNDKTSTKVGNRYITFKK